ncbi:MAG: heme-binding protein [Methanotrichaceae archaeon]|nr:heme-binding protein [Methanotrichaceae archaeon]
MSDSTLEVPYAVIQKFENSVEIRDYPSQVWAMVRDLKQADAFKILNDFVFGKNEKQEKIGIIFPVVAFNSNEGHVFAFIMPCRYKLRTLPKPYRDEIKLESIASRMVAAIAFSGSVTPDSFDMNLRLLQEILRKNGITWSEPPYLFQYNEPWTPPFMRRNEAVIQIIS